MERALRDSFGLADAVVVPTPENELGVQARVAQAAADFLTSLRPVPRVLGVSWGRTLTDVAERMPEGWATGVTVVQINGGVSLNRRPGTASTLASTIAQRANGHAILLPSPAILERLATKKAIESDRTVAAVLERAAEANAYLYSAGVVDANSAHVESGYLRPDDMEELARRGAIGDVVGRYIDANGNIVDPALDERTLGISLDTLRSAAMAILVVAGTAKHDIARAVVTSGLCTVLITDEATARALLEDS
jgi:deoxyribonucleoside regulator